MLNGFEIVLVFGDLSEIPDAVDYRTSEFDVTLTVKAGPADNFESNIDDYKNPKAPAICVSFCIVIYETQRIVLAIQNTAACRRNVGKIKNKSCSSVAPELPRQMPLLC